MERSGRNKWRSMRFLPWGEGLEGRQLLSGSGGRRTSRMRNSKPCLTILSATRRFARTRRSSPLGRQLQLHQPPRLQLHRPPRPLRLQSQETPRLQLHQPPRLLTRRLSIINGYAVIVSSGQLHRPLLNAGCPRRHHQDRHRLGDPGQCLDRGQSSARAYGTRARSQDWQSSDHRLRAQVSGPSTIGAYGSAAKPTGIGPRAVIDQAIIEPGAYVSALARVEPGVTVPSGLLVLPGKTRATNAEASTRTLAMVVTITGNALKPVRSSVSSTSSGRRI